MKNYKYLLIIINIAIGQDLNILEKDLKTARDAFYALPMVQEYEKQREQAYKDVGYSQSDIKKFMTHDAPQTIIAALQKNNRISPNDMKMVKDKGQQAINAFDQFDKVLRDMPTMENSTLSKALHLSNASGLIPMSVDMEAAFLGDENLDTHDKNKKKDLWILKTMEKTGVSKKDAEKMFDQQENIFENTIFNTLLQAENNEYFDSKERFELEKTISDYANAENTVNILRKTIEKLYSTNNYSPDQDFVLQKKLNDAQRAMIDKEIQMNNVWKAYQNKVHQDARESNFNIHDAFKHSIEAYKNENGQKSFNGNVNLDDVSKGQIDQRNSALKMENNKIRNLSSPWSLDSLKYWFLEVPQRVGQSYINKVVPFSNNSDQWFFSRWGSKLYNALPSVSIGYENNAQLPAEKINSILQESKRKQEFADTFNQIKKLNSNLYLNDQEKEYLQDVVHDLSQDPALRNAAKAILNKGIVDHMRDFVSSEKVLLPVAGAAAAAGAIATKGKLSTELLQSIKNKLVSGGNTIKTVGSNPTVPSAESTASKVAKVVEPTVEISTKKPFVVTEPQKTNYLKWLLNIGAAGGTGAAVAHYYGPKQQENNDNNNSEFPIYSNVDLDAIQRPLDDVDDNNMKTLVDGLVTTKDRLAIKELEHIKENEKAEHKWDVIKPWTWNWKIW